MINLKKKLCNFKIIIINLRLVVILLNVLHNYAHIQSWLKFITSRLYNILYCLKIDILFYSRKYYIVKKTFIMYYWRSLNYKSL